MIYLSYICTRNSAFREHSSVGLERLLDKQEVSGSNPLVPTNENQTVAGVRLSFFMPSAEGAMRFAWNG